MPSHTTPFHVLLLSGGNTSRDPQHEEFKRRDDYLAHRFDFLKKKATKYAKDGKKDNTEYSVLLPDAKTRDNIDDNLQSVATPLEIAMIKCCERVTPEEEQATKPIHRSRLHRKICPSNYEEETPDPEESSSSFLSSQAHTDTPGYTSCEDAQQSKGVLLLGKEGHFTAMLSLYCTSHAIGHRALAIAILQRTVEREADVSKQNKDIDAVKSDPDLDMNANTDTNTNELKETTATMEVTNATHKSTHDEKRQCQPRRINNFLEVGGMKLLARWLVDSFTVVRLPKGHEASPTGCLLLPLLHLLKAIPFNKDAVMASQIHKCIKRLKKALDTLVSGLDPSQLKRQKHPISGGLSVGEVISALDETMRVWKESAAAIAAVDGRTADVTEESQHNPYQAMQQQLELRFDVLAKYQSEGGPPPDWLPSSVSPIISGKFNLLAMHAASILNASSLPKAIVSGDKSNIVRQPEKQPGQNDKPAVRRPKDEVQPQSTQKTIAASRENKRTLDDLLFIKRKDIPGSKHAENLQQRAHASTDSTKKVSWVDRPKNREVPPRSLCEERVFYRTVEEREDSIIQERSQCVDQNGSIAEVKEGGSLEDSELEDLCLDI